MGMFFNSWKDDDASYYYESLDASDHYNRGYYDGRDDGRKENEGNLDKAYRKGFEAGRKKAIEDLMEKLFDLFGKDVDLPHLVLQKVLESKIEKLSKDDDACLKPSLSEEASNESIDEPVDADSLDDAISEMECNDDNTSELIME
jgi:hypothetical protein